MMNNDIYDQLTLDQQKSVDMVMTAMCPDEYTTEVDDLPDDINERIVEHPNKYTFDDTDEYENKIFSVIKNTNDTYPDILMTNIQLEGVCENEYEKKYNENKSLSIDYRYWHNTDEALLTIEDQFNTEYCTYNREIMYLDNKLDLQLILKTFKEKIITL